MDVPRCYACEDKVDAPEDPRNPLCGRCAPVRDHVVSMQRIGPNLAAICRCGWHFQAPARRDDARELAIRKHWRAVIAPEVAA